MFLYVGVKKFPWEPALSARKITTPLLEDF
jgi:hypothetical protein